MRWPSGFILAASLASLFTVGRARADPKAACLTAHEHGQEIRLQNKWVEARTLFLSCAQSSCPAPLVKDCTTWASELALQIPSIVVSAKRPDGSDTDDAALVVDGGAPLARLPSTPIPLNPGRHVVRLEHPGWPRVEAEVVLHDGEHDQSVKLQFSAPATAAATDAEPPRRPVPVGAYVATGLAAAVAAMSVTFLVTGKIAEHNLATSPCGLAGMCTNAQVDPIRADYIVSGVAAGTAAIALGVALWQFLGHRSSRATATASLLCVSF